MLLGCFLLFSVGELNFDLFLTSSNNLTATVESNAATEKKKRKKFLGPHSMHFDGFELCFLACFTATWQLGRPSLAKLLFVEFCGLVFGTAAVFLCRSGIRICFEILRGFSNVL